MEQTPPSTEEEQIRGFSDEVVQQLLSFGSVIAQESSQTLGTSVDRNTGTVRFCAVLALLSMIQLGFVSSYLLAWASLIPMACALAAFGRALNLPATTQPDPSSPTEEEWFRDGILNDAARLRQAHLAAMVRCHQKQRQVPAPDPVVRRWIVACVFSAAAVRIAAAVLSQSR